MVKIKIQKIHKDAVIPSYATPGDSGMDLHTVEEIVLEPMHRAMVPTGLKIALPHGYESQIRPKSGLAIKQGISIVNTPGTIDAEYRGEYMVLLINYGSKTVKIEKGQKIAQLMIKKIEQAKIQVVDTLDKTRRGSGGFGSTGK